MYIYIIYIYVYIILCSAPCFSNSAKAKGCEAAAAATKQNTGSNAQRSNGIITKPFLALQKRVRAYSPTVYAPAAFALRHMRRNTTRASAAQALQLQRAGVCKNRIHRAPLQIRPASAQLECLLKLLRVGICKRHVMA